jgi:transposase
MGVDEIHVGKKEKFLTVVCDLETAEPLWFGRERKKETLDAFFRDEWSARQWRGIEAACVDMWEPFRLSMAEWIPNCRILYDKFHVMQHANAVVEEVRRAEFFPQGRADARFGERETLATAEPMGEGAMLNYLQRWIAAKSLRCAASRRYLGAILGGHPYTQ